MICSLICIQVLLVSLLFSAASVYQLLYAVTSNSRISHKFCFWMVTVIVIDGKIFSVFYSIRYFCFWMHTWLEVHMLDFKQRSAAFRFGFRLVFHQYNKIFGSQFRFWQLQDFGSVCFVRLRSLINWKLFWLVNCLSRYSGHSLSLLEGWLRFKNMVIKVTVSLSSYSSLVRQSTIIRIIFCPYCLFCEENSTIPESTLAKPLRGLPRGRLLASFSETYCSCF